jgi:hypothetical protein
VAEEGDSHELAADAWLHKEERHHRDRTEGDQPGSLKWETARLAQLPTRHSQHDQDCCGEEKDHSNKLSIILRDRGEKEHEHYPGEEHHPRKPAPIEGRSAKIDERHEDDGGRKLEAVLQLEGCQGRDHDAQSGRPAVLQHIAQARAVGRLVSMWRVVVCGVVAGPIR